MLFPIKNRKKLEELEGLVSLKTQINEARLQNRFVEQNYHQNVKNLYEPLAETIENTSENLTKTIKL